MPFKDAFPVMHLHVEDNAVKYNLVECNIKLWYDKTLDIIVVWKGEIIDSSNIYRPECLNTS